MNSSNGHHELGRRLIAALLSYERRLPIDHVLQNYVPEDIHPSWEILGRALLRDLQTEFDPEIEDYLRN